MTLTNELLSCVLRVCLGIVVLLASDKAHGETFPLANVIPHSIPEPLRPKLQSLARQHADALYNHLLLRTDEAERVCGLPETDVALLELAAKGSVQHAIDDWLAAIAAEYAADPNGATAQMLTMRINGQVEAVKVVAVEDGGVRGVILRNNGQVIRIEHENVLQELFRRRARKQPGGEGFGGGGIGGGGFGGGGFGGGRFGGGEGIGGGGVALRPAKPQEAVSLNLDPAGVVESGVWRTTLGRLLTDEQRVKLIILRTRRDAPAGESQLDLMLKFVDEQLLLDAGQQERFREWADRFLVTRSSTLDGTTLALIAMKTFPAEELAELLSARQQSQWREVMQKRMPPFDAYRPNVDPEELFPQLRQQRRQPRAAGF